MSQSADAPSSDTPPSLETMYGFNADIGFRLTEWTDGYAKMELDLTEKHLNRSGILHGGVLATMIDAVGGYCGVWVPKGSDKKRALTLSLTTSYLGQAKEGTIVAYGKRRGGGKSVFFATCEVYNPEGVLIAMGEGTYKIRQSKGPIG
ncbi:PaaI family thioesterase [Nisaea sediminum]|uniref:PaaI family thioesterase n=1 Tax=Nisaea sediminum TaxID=2775867 RepID=UPI001D020742|nr:PaaI family thioesterase [Nisaea sediminum]